MKLLANGRDVHRTARPSDDNTPPAVAQKGRNWQQSTRHRICAAMGRSHKGPTDTATLWGDGNVLAAHLVERRLPPGGDLVTVLLCPRQLATSTLPCDTHHVQEVKHSEEETRTATPPASRRGTAHKLSSPDPLSSPSSRPPWAAPHTTARPARELVTISRYNMHNTKSIAAPRGGGSARLAQSRAAMARRRKTPISAYCRWARENSSSKTPPAPGTGGRR